MSQNPYEVPWSEYSILLGVMAHNSNPSVSSNLSGNTEALKQMSGH